MKKLIVLTGPTAVGKTALSIALAKAIGGEIISADSMQVYKYMDIGSAKIRPEEMDGVRHYLVDILDPHEDFNVFMFQKYAKEAIKQIYANGHIPILVGGTGFYIQSVLYDIDFTESTMDEKYRNGLEAIAMQDGPEALFTKLKEVDPESATAIHPNNVKRVIRALEYYHQTGEKISSHNEEERNKTSPYDFTYFVLNDDRNVLYHNIDLRVDKMIANGLVDEVAGLKAMGLKKTDVSMQGLGYKEFFDYFDGRMTLEDTVDKIKKDTRHFAKRQLTWFRREPSVTWVDFSQIRREDALSYMLEQLKEKEII